MRIDAALPRKGKSRKQKAKSKVKGERRKVKGIKGLMGVFFNCTVNKFI